MKTLIIYIAKKYVISAINDLLEKYKDNVSEISNVIELWIKRLQIIVEELKNILNRITNDNKIDDKEIKESIKEISDIIKKW